VFYGYMKAATKLAMRNPCPRTAGVLRMWELLPDHFKTQIPKPGAIYFLDHGKGLGHEGIVEAVTPALVVASEISGNTNEQGSREGNAIARHLGPPELSHHGKLLGYADFSLPVPAVA
jgi:hypothetical protein